MSTAWSDIGTALTTFVSNLDISSVAAGGWNQVLNYPPKQVTAWPTAVVHPSEGQDVELDSHSDTGEYTYWIELVYSWEDAATAEAKTRALADLLHGAVLSEVRGTPPFGFTDAYAIGNITHSWGFSEDGLLRYYRIAITLRVEEPLV